MVSHLSSTSIVKTSSKVYSLPVELVALRLKTCIPIGRPESAETETFPEGFSTLNAPEKLIATSPAVASGLSLNNDFGKIMSH